MINDRNFLPPFLLSFFLGGGVPGPRSISLWPYITYDIVGAKLQVLLTSPIMTGTYKPFTNYQNGTLPQSHHTALLFTHALFHPHLPQFSNVSLSKFFVSPTLSASSGEIVYVLDQGVLPQHKLHNMLSSSHLPCPISKLFLSNPLHFFFFLEGVCKFEAEPGGGVVLPQNKLRNILSCVTWPNVQLALR